MTYLYIVYTFAYIHHRLNIHKLNISNPLNCYKETKSTKENKKNNLSDLTKTENNIW